MNAASRLPERTQRATNQTPLTFEGHRTGPFAGVRRWSSVPNVEHMTLCRAFQLDPARFYFDVASTLRGVGSNSGAHSSRRGQADGFVFMTGRAEPVARLRMVREGEKLWDADVMSDRDYEVLDRTW